jgi:hypothetical protein
MDDDLHLAHEHCFCNQSEVLASEICGCFSCATVFPPSAIANWTLETEPPLIVDNRWVAVRKTEPSALCPHCGIDTVIGSRSGFPITAEFLSRMQKRWFPSSA